MRTVAGLCLLLCALLACKQGDQDEKKSKAKPEASARAEASAKPAARPSASAALPPAPAQDRPVGELFDGAPTGVEFGARVRATHEGTWHVSVPKGWKANTEQSRGMVILTSLAGDAQMFMSDAIGTAPDENMALRVGGGFQHAQIEWDEPHADGKFGPGHRNARVNTGQGTLFNKPAVFWAVRPDAGDLGVLIEGGLVEGAPDARRAELLAAMQSVELK